MQVDIVVSRAFEASILSSCALCDLAEGLGIPRGVDLRISPDRSNHKKFAATRIIVRCDQQTASRLRHQFSSVTPYVHDGVLTSLRVVASKPTTFGKCSVLKRRGDVRGTLPIEDKRRQCRSRASCTPPTHDVVKWSSAPTTSTTAEGWQSAVSSIVSGGVQAALSAVEKEEAAGLRTVPGIIELYNEFLRGTTSTTARTRVTLPLWPHDDDFEDAKSTDRRRTRRNSGRGGYSTTRNGYITEDKLETKNTEHGTEHQIATSMESKEDERWGYSSSSSCTSATDHSNWSHTSRRCRRRDDCPNETQRRWRRRGGSSRLQCWEGKEAEVKTSSRQPCLRRTSVDFRHVMEAMPRDSKIGGTRSMDMIALVYPSDGDTASQQGEEELHMMAEPKSGRRFSPPSKRKILRQKVDAHRHRWHLRHARTCMAEAILAIARIRRKYPESIQRPVDHSRIITLLAKLYADGVVFAANRQRDMDTLDRLEVVQWRSLANVQPSYTITRDGDRWRACEKINAVVANWARLLARVTGLTRNILDFGVFVQLYVAASESDRLATAAAVEATRGRGEGAKTQNKRNDRKPTTRRIHGIQKIDDYLATSTKVHQEDRNTKDVGGYHDSGGGSDGVSTRKRESLSASISPSSPETHRKHPETASFDDSSTSNNAINMKKNACARLQWLFSGGGGEGGEDVGGGAACNKNGETTCRREFERRVVCGGAIHGRISVEAAAAIIQDAPGGRHISAGSIWRWRCCSRASAAKQGSVAVPATRTASDRGDAVGGRSDNYRRRRSSSSNSRAAATAAVAAEGRREYNLLSFEEFVEMCEELREDISNTIVMD